MNTYKVIDGSGETHKVRAYSFEIFEKAVNTYVGFFNKDGKYHSVFKDPQTIILTRRGRKD